MMVKHQNIPLGSSIPQEIYSVSVACVATQDTHGIAHVGRRCRLIIAPVCIIYGQSRIKRQRSIKHAIITINLMDFTERQGGINFQSVLQYPLFKNKSATILLAFGGDIQNVGLLIVQARTIISIFVGTINR